MGEALEVSFTAAMLPDDVGDAILAGRLNLPQGPTPVLIRDGFVEDMSRVAATMSDLLDRPDPIAEQGERLFPLEALFDKAAAAAPGTFLLSPLDLQVVKAAGVTFAISAIERVIEERARGDSDAAASIRDKLEARIGGAIRSVVPGTPEAATLKAALIEDGLWSQYLEVAIGPDAEIFTKAAVLSTVGTGAEVGIRSDSNWNNPEPEIAILADEEGEPVGACLGNDVNLRDFEGRSALLLGKAKDNNASASLGPMIRLFDAGFSLEDVKQSVIALNVTGEDGFVLEGSSSMSQISRPPESIVAAAIGRHHQYPDGFVVYLGTMFAPVKDRGGAGKGFTHKPNDIVTISTPLLGALTNRVRLSTECPPWTYGASHLMRDLSKAGLLN